MRGMKPHPEGAERRDRTPAAAKVYAELRRRILHGELAAGTQLNEVDTAAELDVSRTPVREAMRELLSDGLIEEGPRRQSRVATGSPELDREVRLMRVALESVAVREAALGTDPARCDALRLTLIKMQRAAKSGDLNALHDCVDDFHIQIAYVAELPLVADTIRRLRGLTRLVGLSVGWGVDDLTRSVADHDRLIDAIDSRDPDAAEQLLREHLLGLRGHTATTG